MLNTFVLSEVMHQPTYDYKNLHVNPLFCNIIHFIQISLVLYTWPHLIPPITSVTHLFLIKMFLILFPLIIFLLIKP